eukprot:COSAG01_NODE_913_length_12779_cov_9.134385_15_plen_195_part_00
MEADGALPNACAGAGLPPSESLPHEIELEPEVEPETQPATQPATQPQPPPLTALFASDPEAFWARVGEGCDAAALAAVRAMCRARPTEAGGACTLSLYHRNICEPAAALGRVLASLPRPLPYTRMYLAGNGLGPAGLRLLTTNKMSVLPHHDELFLLIALRLWRIALLWHSGRLNCLVNCGPIVLIPPANSFCI